MAGSVDVELPEEVLALLGEHEETDAKRLAAITDELIALRGDAIAARRESGIEDVWRKAEEAYVGIDDANRATFSNARWAKPISMTRGLTITSVGGGEEVQSTAYVRLTSRYVDAGAAKLGEILLPAGEKAFSFSPTPVPDLIDGLADNRQVAIDGVPLERDARPEELAGQPGAAPLLNGATPAAPGAQPPGVPITVKDLAAERMAKAAAAARKAELRIYDWMVESRYRAHMRKVVFDAARLGVGVLKGPFPHQVTSRMFDRDSNTLKVKHQLKPGYEWKSPWNIYPARTCGESIREGDYLFELDFFSKKQLRKLKGQPGYIGKAIDRVLGEGPASGDLAGGSPGEQHKKDRYFVWYFHGVMKGEDYALVAGQSGEDNPGKPPEEVSAICTMVNDTIIRASINPLDTGDIPYHNVPWSRREDHWAGIGLAEQLEMPARAINAATRALFNNAGKSSGSIVVIDDEAIVPGDGNYTLLPDKVFMKKPGATMDDVRKAFAFFQVPNTTSALMSIIDLCLRMAEEVTNIPLITQGQSGKTTPETYGATALQNNNANQLLRTIGYAVDDYITEPVVHQSYEYLLLDPSVPAEEKGDWKIDAHGSSALVERAIEEEFIQQMGQFALNPAFGVNPKRWFAKLLRVKRLDPAEVQHTEAEQAEIDKRPVPPPPAVQVAQLRSEDHKAALAAEQEALRANAAAQKELQAAADATRKEIAAMRKEVDMMRVRKDTDRDTVYVQAETARTQAEGQARMRELEIRREIALLGYANKRGLTLDDIKADLAKTEMTLQVQRELAGVAEVAKSAAEPAGKAPNGEAFTK